MKPVLVLLVAVVIQLSACAQDLAHPADSPATGFRIPPDCNRPNLLVNGNPVMVPARGGVNIGISLAQHEFKSGEPIKLHLWVDNPSDSSAPIFTCMDLGLFKRSGFQIFGQNGQRILSRGEVKWRGECSTNPSLAEAWGQQVCLRNIMLRIPANTCMTRDDYDFTAELTSSYDLPPGTYTIQLRTDWRAQIDLCKPESNLGTSAGQNELSFTVTEP